MTLRVLASTIIAFAIAVYLPSIANAQANNHRQIRLTIEDPSADTKPTPFGFVDITRRGDPSCSEVSIQLINTVPRPRGTIFSLYLHTDQEPMFRIKSFNTEFFTQVGKAQGVFCSIVADLIDHWLDPSVPLQAFILSEAVAEPPLAPVPFCVGFGAVGCMRFAGED